MPLGSWLSDKYRSRAIPYAIFNIISVIGFIMLLSTGNKVIGVVACCFVAAGCVSLSPCPLPSDGGVEY